MKTRQMRNSLVLCATILTSTAIHEISAFSLHMSSPTTKTAVIAGATGYIGKSVVRESVRQGYRTVALVRDTSKVTSKEGQALYGQFLEGADVVECDVCNSAQLAKVGFEWNRNVENVAFPTSVENESSSLLFHVLSYMFTSAITQRLQTFADRL
jgi:putative NADH-flavin reductase